MNRPTQPLPLQIVRPPGRRFEAGRLIFAQGEIVHSLHMVHAGMVRLVVHTLDGRTGVLEVLGAGDVFGETAVLGPMPSPVEARAATECRVALVQRAAWLPDVTERLAERLARASQSLSAALVLDAPARLERLLLDLADRHGTPVRGGVRIDLPLTQSELAAMIGVSRETVNRTVGGLVARGRLQVQGRRYMVLDAWARRYAAS